MTMTRLPLLFASLLTLAAGCASHNVLSTRDGGPPADLDAGPPSDARACGDTAPACHPLLTDERGAACCDAASSGAAVCVGGAWTCPGGDRPVDACGVLSATGYEGCGLCEPMDAHTRPANDGCLGLPSTSYRWDGRACRPILTGCGRTPCEGSDCGDLFLTLNDCMGAYGMCGAGACEAMDVQYGTPDPEPCDDTGAVTWYWNGWACQRFVGCRASDDNCAGAECADRYASRAQCEAARAGCLSQCDAMDVAISGCLDPGPTERYFFWNGHDCESQLSCPEVPECVGTECGALFGDLESCRAAYRECPAPAIPHFGLTCGLDEGGLVRAALRLEACSVASANNTIGGYFELGLGLPGPSPNPGYVPDCAVVGCAASAPDCPELANCLAGQAVGACPADTISTCDGTRVVSCRDGALQPLGDCGLLGGTCETETVSGGRALASCDVPGNPTGGSFSAATWCDRDALVMSVGGESVRIDCGAAIPGTVCRDVRYAGEFPGAVCGYPAPTCSEYLSESIGCAGDEALLCVGGQPRRIDCVAAGYAGCVEGRGCQG